jgi:hypothetical protein
VLRFSRPALLLASASLAAGVLTAPSPAFAADTTTSLTKTQMAAALKGVATTTAAAAEMGWGGTYKVTLNTISGSAKFAVDPTGGRAYYELNIDRQISAGYAVANKGSYDSLSTREEFNAVKMIGRPAAKYVYTTNPKLDLNDWVAANEPRPTTFLTEDTGYAGTKTAHDDGTSTYSFKTVDDTVNTFQVSAEGQLQSFTTKYGSFMNATLAYHYGPQTVSLPPVGQTVSRASLTKALAYVNMPAELKEVATRSAALTKKSARGKTIKVAALRKTAKSVASAHNSSVRIKVVSVKDIKGGARISAKNPYTGQTVTYTIKAAGKKVVVKRA